MRIVTVFIAAVLLGSAPFGSALAQRGTAPPQVTVTSLEPLPRVGGEQRFRAVFRVDNLNTEPMKLRGIEFSLRLAHQGLLDGRLPAMTIEALDQQVITLELRSDLIASASQLLTYAEGPENTLPYEMVCKVTYERRKIDPVNFATEGTVPVVLTGAR